MRICIGVSNCRNEVFVNKILYSISHFDTTRKISTIN